MKKPAVLGGKPIFLHPIPFVRPALPPFRALRRPLAELFKTGILTKGQHLDAFEAEVAGFLGVRHAVGVVNCTIGLLLVFQALELKGEVIVPSYTFMATVHPLLWVGARPIFVEVDPKTWNIRPDEVRRKVTAQTSAIVAVHTFGNPAPVEELEAIAREKNLKLIFDAAHGFGSLYNNRRLGRYGHAEVFSTSPTKVLVTGEGGVVATNNDELAQRIRTSREYGNLGDYNTVVPGLNGRMQEFSALLGVQGLKMVEEVAARRNEVALHYRETLGVFSGLTFQSIQPGGRSSYKDFTILVDELLFGVSRDCLAWALRAEGIDTRNYYDPPVHLHDTYRPFRAVSDGGLPLTESISKMCLSLPIGSHLKKEHILRIASAFERVQRHSDAVKDRFASQSSPP